MDSAESAIIVAWAILGSLAVLALGWALYAR